jgi:hypothetical protein
MTLKFSSKNELQYHIRAWDVGKDSHAQQGERMMAVVQGTKGESINLLIQIKLNDINWRNPDPFDLGPWRAPENTVKMALK